MYTSWYNLGMSAYGHSIVDKIENVLFSSLYNFNCICLWRAIRFAVRQGEVGGLWKNNSGPRLTFPIIYTQNDNRDWASWWNWKTLYLVLVRLINQMPGLGLGMVVVLGHNPVANLILVHFTVFVQVSEVRELFSLSLHPVWLWTSILMCKHVS